MINPALISCLRWFITEAIIRFQKHSFVNTPEWPPRNNHTVVLSLPSLLLLNLTLHISSSLISISPSLASSLSLHLISVSLHPSSFSPSEHGRGDIPSFYTCEEGLSSLNSEGEATLNRLEGMLARSVAQQFHMAGVRTDDTSGDFDGIWKI